MAERNPHRWAIGRWVLIGCAALFAFMFLPDREAIAHAVFVSATPPPGASLSTAPASVRIEFSEPLDADMSGIDVYTSSGRHVRPRSARVDPRDSRAYVDELPRLHPDRYAVMWHTVSATDGHSRRGSYTFTVDLPDGAKPTVHPTVVPLPSSPQPPTWVQAVVRLVGLIGLFALAGSVLVAALGSGTGVFGPAGSWRRLHVLSYMGCGALIAGTLGDTVSAWASLGRGGAALGELLVSPAGRWWETRLAVVLAMICLVPRAAPRRLPAGRGCVLATGVGVIVLSYAATSHGAAALPSGAGLAYDVVHVLAASIWLGGAAAVGTIWAGARRAGVADRRTLLHRYSVTAGIAVPAVLLSGLGNAVLEVGNIGDLVRTSYGTTLLVKLAVLALLVAVAAVNAIVLKPAFDAGHARGRRLDRTIAIEAVLGLVVLAPTAVLAVLAPSRPSDAAHAVAARVQAQTDPADTFTGSARLGGRAATIDVTPGAVGTNAVRVEIAGINNGLRLVLQSSGADGSDTASLTRTGLDHDPAPHTIYQGVIQLTHTGLQHAILHPIDGGAPSVPVPMLVSAGQPAGYQPAQSLVTRWLVMIALTGLAAVLIATARAVPHRRLRSTAIATGGAGLSVAAVWAGLVGLGPPAAHAAGWAAARPVSALTIGDGRVWRMPTPAAGVMMPATAPDGSVWVAEMDSNKLARLDPAADVVQEFRFPGPQRESMGVAVAPDGRVWVAQEHAMALGMFDPAVGRYREFPIPGADSAPVGVAVGTDGTIWFTESSGNRVGSFDPGTERFTEYAVPTPDALPYWVTVDTTGRVWFTEFGAGKIGSLDPRSGRVRQYRVPGAPNVAGIAMSHDGSVWFVTCQGTLFDLDPTSGRLRPIRLPVAGDYGVAVGRTGRVWVGRNGGRTVFAVDPVTGRARGYDLPAGSAPWWPVVDGSGQVWVALAGAGGNGLAQLHQPS